MQGRREWKGMNKRHRRLGNISIGINRHFPAPHLDKYLVWIRLDVHSPSHLISMLCTLRLHQVILFIYLFNDFFYAITSPW